MENVVIPVNKEGLQDNQYLMYVSSSNSLTGSFIDTSNLLTSSSFNNFTQSYLQDSSSFDAKINNTYLSQSNYILTSSFNNYTSSLYSYLVWNL
jgi:hypothetical protein